MKKYNRIVFINQGRDEKTQKGGAAFCQVKRKKPDPIIGQACYFS